MCARRQFIFHPFSSEKCQQKMFVQQRPNSSFQSKEMCAQLSLTIIEHAGVVCPSAHTCIALSEVRHMSNVNLLPLSARLLKRVVVVLRRCKPSLIFCSSLYPFTLVFNNSLPAECVLRERVKGRRDAF
jgi:hypothetical protein